MKIEWDEQVLPRGTPKPSVFGKLKNAISVFRPTTDTPPRPSRRSTDRSSSNHHSSSRSSSRHPPRPASAPPRSHHHSSGHSTPQRPTVTIPHGSSANINARGGHTYIIQSPGGASPRSGSPRRTSLPPSPRSPPPTPQRRTSGQHTPHASSPLRPGPTRAATSPAGGVMFEGKLIVGDAADVQRYIDTQRRIQNWAGGVGR